MSGLWGFLHTVALWLMMTSFGTVLRLSLYPALLVVYRLVAHATTASGDGSPLSVSEVDVSERMGASAGFSLVCCIFSLDRLDRMDEQGLSVYLSQDFPHCLSTVPSFPLTLQQQAAHDCPIFTAKYCVAFPALRLRHLTVHSKRYGISSKFLECRLSPHLH
ncbi:hypothetical protein GGR57DRAFT_232791 [Xylariaceae sp. FL1272]|nr:hypothetical protein GGR57DRAFT_232791 [Xylariaceae sp. FL1272]